MTANCPMAVSFRFEAEAKIAVIDLQNALEAAVCTLRLVKLLSALAERGNSVIHCKILSFFVASLVS